MKADLIAQLVVIFAIYLIALPHLRRWFRKKSKSRYWNRDKYRSGWPNYLRLVQPYKPDLSDPNIAIQYVQLSQYSVRPIMNKEAYFVFMITERFFKDLKQGHRVIPEMCMGAVLHCADEEGFSSINSKRLDIGVINRTGSLILAIEYNGSGHYQGNAVARDAIKKMALNKAQVPLIEIVPEDSESDIIEKIKLVIGFRHKNVSTYISFHN